jgi:Tfp pilus assembly protein PilN
MHDLEFLPDWYPQTRRRRRLVLLQGWLTLVVLFGLGGWVLLAERNIAVAEDSLRTLKGQLSQTDAQLAEMDKLDVMRKQLSQQNQILSRIGLNNVEACSMVHRIDAIMPRQMSLTGMRLENEEHVDTSAASAVKGDQPVDRRLKVTIQGVCPTDVDLANFMTQLQAEKYFDMVNLTYAREKSDSNHVMREFEITFSINLNGGGN